MIRKIDKANKFVSIFIPQTGFYMRTGVIDENGNDTGVDPFMTSYPELIDVGVMGHCVHGVSGLCMKSGVQCYQNGLNTKVPNMSLIFLQNSRAGLHPLCHLKLIEMFYLYIHQRFF
jgi:hypothetical protein